MDRWIGAAYWSRSTEDLHRLASEKYLKLLKLRREPRTYFNQQEIKKVDGQRNAILAILASRDAQLGLGE